MVHVHPLGPVVAFDIDGTTGDYHEHFRQFASMWVGREIYLNWSLTKDGEFSEALGLEKHIYRQIKLAYRQGGMKRSMPAARRVAQNIQYLQSQDAQVWFCTTRPWERLDNIDPDTKEWFRRNGIEPYGLIYGPDKYHDLFDIVGSERVVAIVDDLPEQIEAANDLGLKTIMMTGRHNQWWRDQHPDQHIVRNIWEATNDIDVLLEEWRSNNG